MKRIISALIAFVCSVSFGATLTPIQLLNPAGSSSGQAIISTGASSAPAWGGVGVNGIAAIAANTVLANASGSSASPTAFAMPSCSASGSALNWTANSGFTCRSSYAMTTGATFTGSITPSTTSGIVGTTLADNANAGSVGEYVTSGAVTTGNLTSGTNANITSISLTAGDWNVWGVGAWTPGGATMSNTQIGISTTSATFGPFGSTTTLFESTTSGNGLPAPMVRVNVSTTTTVYLVTQAGFSGGTGTTATGIINARRIR